MTLRVLLVDDEPLVREELQESLEFEGFEVDAAASVSDALTVCEAQSFDVVITDLKMPGAGGLDLLRALRDGGNPAKVMVLSGHGAASNRDEATGLGAVACFAKPVDVDELTEMIGKVCE